MAMKIEKEHSPNILNRLSVEDLDVIEESTSDSDDDLGHKNSLNNLSLAKNPPDLDLSTSKSPAINSVAIHNSENVHFGNKTYFNGPVTIKQIIQAKSGIENGAYVKTEQEESPDKKSPNDVKPKICKFTQISKYSYIILFCCCLLRYLLNFCW